MTAADLAPPMSPPSAGRGAWFAAPRQARYRAGNPRGHEPRYRLKGWHALLLVAGAHAALLTWLAQTKPAAWVVHAPGPVQVSLVGSPGPASKAVEVRRHAVAVEQRLTVPAGARRTADSSAAQEERQVAPVTEPPAGADTAQRAPTGTARVAELTLPRFDAAYLRNPAPVYPLLARRLGEQGQVVLRVRVSQAGAAEEIEIASASGFARLDQAAVEAVRRWRFVPARRGMQGTAAWVLVPIAFKLES